jgi:hypothetical protein
MTRRSSRSIALRPWLPILVALTLLAASCGKDGQSNASATTTTAAPATTTTTAAGSSGEGAQAARKGSKNDKSSPVGIAFAAVATLLLGAVSVRLLASKP